MPTLIDELEQCFNAIPRDGSNVATQDSDEDFEAVMAKASAAKADDEGDDNGYEVASKVDKTPFEEKLAEVVHAVAQAPATPTLPVTPAAVPAPKAETKPEPKAEPKAVAEPAATPKPDPVVSSVSAEEDAKGVAAMRRGASQTPVEAIEPKLAEAAASRPAPLDKSATPFPAAPAENDIDFDRELDKSRGEAVLGPAATKAVSPATPAPSAVDGGTVGEHEEKRQAVRSAAQQGSDVAGTVVPSDPDTSGATSDAIVWQLHEKFPQHAEFYGFKRSILPFLLRGGRLPLDRFDRELRESKAVVECSYDLRSMYEQMKYVQRLRVRVTEIATLLNSQFFLWKRFMEILRAEAAKMDGLKVGQADAASLRHLWDFELYFEQVRALTESAEHCLKTLEAAWNTLNRGVTIVLEAHGHDRGLTRYESHRDGGNAAPRAVQPPAPDLGGFDSLDIGPSTTPDGGSPPRPAGGRPSSSLLLKKGGGNEWGDDL